MAWAESEILPMQIQAAVEYIEGGIVYKYHTLQQINENNFILSKVIHVRVDQRVIIKVEINQNSYFDWVVVMHLQSGRRGF